jgi:pentatricopeptide repeat protein
MLDNGASPNIVTCTTLVDGFSKEGMIGEAFLLWMKYDSLILFPTSVLTEFIINGLCKANISDDVWTFFADMIKMGYVPDTVVTVLLLLIL